MSVITQSNTVSQKKNPELDKQYIGKLKGFPVEVKLSILSFLPQQTCAVISKSMRERLDRTRPLSKRLYKDLSGNEKNRIIVDMLWDRHASYYRTLTGSKPVSQMPPPVVWMKGVFEGLKREVSKGQDASIAKEFPRRVSLGRFEAMQSTVSANRDFATMGLWEKIAGALRVNHRACQRPSHVLKTLSSSKNQKAIRSIKKIDHKGVVEAVRHGGQILRTFPREIRFLVGLTHLRMTHTDIQFIPSEIRFLKNLKELHITCNSVLQSLPKEIGGLTKLQVLNLDSNNITSLPEEIGDLRELRKLDLRCNELRSLPKQFENLNGLVSLNIEYNKFREIPGEVQKLKEKGLQVIKFKKVSNQTIAGMSLDFSWFPMPLPESKSERKSDWKN